MTDQPAADDTAEETAEGAAEPESERSASTAPGSEASADPNPGPELEPEPEPEPSPGPQPLGITLEATGNTQVDALLERLADADDLPTEHHIEVYEDVHRGLRDALTALDSRPGPPGPGQRHDDRS